MMRRLLGVPWAAVGLVGAPLAWAGLLTADYVLLSWSCTAAAEGAAVVPPATASWLLAAGTAAGALLIAAAALASRRAWRRAGTTERPGDPSREARHGFLAFGGLYFAAAFLFGTLLLVLALVTASPCGGTP